MKTCSGCHQAKPIDSFYLDKKNNRRSKCKACNAAIAKKWQESETGQKSRLAAKIRYRKTEHGKAKEKEYQKSERGREALRIGKIRFAERHPGIHETYLDNYKEKNPEKIRAWKILRSAVRYGEMEKPTACEKCEIPAEPHGIHGHHPDYSKPLEVMWLCNLCHKEEHKAA